MVLPLVLLALALYGGWRLDHDLHHVNALIDYPDRVGQTAGTNWLLVGSDSRVGLTEEQKRQLATGDNPGEGRTDTIMLVHIPKSGAATVVSIPRDSYVPIPGFGKDKINAAYAFGAAKDDSNPDLGPQLLIRTVESTTGLHIDHYAEVGFTGFAEVVDAIGGIHLCIPRPMDDPKAGLHLQPGCQTLNGDEALGFVRTRKDIDDLGRIDNQRLFLSELMRQAASPRVLLNPFKLWPFAHNTARSLVVDKTDHIWDLAQLGWALHGHTVTTTVPIAGFTDVSGSGNVVLWDKTKASEFFDDLAHDRQLPADLRTPGPDA